MLVSIAGPWTVARAQRSDLSGSSERSPQPAGDDSLELRQAITQQLALVKQLLQQGRYVEAQQQFRVVLQLEAKLRGPQRPRATAPIRQATRPATRRISAHLQRLARTLAEQVALEKAQALAKREAKARQQLARAREGQLKFLYNKGLRLYQQRKFEDAITTFQQMVLVDPAHPLVREAQRLMGQAEVKQEAKALARAPAPAAALPSERTAMSELERQLTAKRIELETMLKYAKVAVNERNYETAIDLLQRVLAENPRDRDAHLLLERAKLARVEDEEARLTRKLARDEQTMLHEVTKALALPEPQSVVAAGGRSPGSASNEAMTAKLRQPISLEFTEVPLSDVLEFIADAAGVSIIPSPQLDLKARQVSLKVTQLPLELALKYLAKNQSLAYRVEQDAILIATSEEFSNEPLQTRVFFLRNGLGPFALQTSAVQSNPVVPMDSMKDLIEKTVPQLPDSKLIVDERSGAIIATNTEENLGLIERLLSQLDVTPVQVLIEARFVELVMTELEQRAFEAVLNDNATLSKKTEANQTRGAQFEIASGGGFKFPALAREDEGVNLTLQGVLTGTKFEQVLHFLEETKKSKTLSAPRVTTLNNQTATIRVVDEFRYPTRYEVSLIQFDINGDGDFDDAGETEFANVPQDIQQRDVGILLHATPSVGKDAKSIRLILAPEVSQFSQFRDLGGGVTVPEFTSSQLTTQVLIEDGQTIVLGGLMKDTVSEEVSKVPVLGDLPVVGELLFRQRREKRERKNLLIFITARILAPRGQTI